MSHITGHGQLDANAEPFDPVIGFLPAEDKAFALFQQLQSVNIQMQTLQNQINSISVPTFNQINNQMLTVNYLSNPVLYLQLQQQQLFIRQTVLQQQQQLQSLKESAVKLQNAYHKARESESTQSTSPPPTSPQPQSQSQFVATHKYPAETTRNVNKSPLSMIIEDSFEIQDGEGDDDDDETDVDDVDDVSGTESPEYPLTSSMTDTIIEASNEPNDPNDHASDALINISPLNAAEDVCYSMEDLMSFQSQFVDIEWSQFPEIPTEIRFIGTDFDHKTFMDDMLAAISRRCVHRFSDRKVCDDIKKKAMKKLKGILNRVTPTKFAKTAKETMDIILDYAQNKNEMEDILRLILEFGTKQSVFSEQYAKLIEHLFDYLPRLRMISDCDWIVSDDQLSKTFRTMVIIESHKLFYQYINHSVVDVDETEERDTELIEIKKEKQKKTFIDFLKLCGNLYNVDMLKIGVIYKGIIDELLPPKNTSLCEIDIDGICGLFKQCGDKLDEENAVRLDSYLNKIKQLSKGFGFRTRCLVDEIKEMRLKDWTHRIHKEKPKELDVIKKEFEDEQQQKQAPPQRTDFVHTKKRYHEREDGRYRSKDYYVQHTKSRNTHRTKKTRRDRRYDDGYDDRYYAHGEHTTGSYYYDYKSKRSQSRRYRQDEHDYNGYDDGEYRGHKKSRSRRSSYSHSHSYAQRHRSYGNYY